MTKAVWKFYRLSIRVDHGSSVGFEFFTNRREAEAALHREIKDKPDEDHEIEEIEIRPTKSGILEALSLYASHADNG